MPAQGSLMAATPDHDLTIVKAAENDGHFRHVRTRAIRATTNGLRLAQAAAIQPEFDFSDVEATLVGIWAPRFSSAFNAAGYHFHFLWADLSKDTAKVP
jgi:acetolactate decarboxylase